MEPSAVKSLALVIGLAALGCGVQSGSAMAQGTMPPGSYTCKPLSEENFLQPPPTPPSKVLTPEEQAYLDSMKLPPDLCPPGMIAYPVPIYDDVHPGHPAEGNLPDVPKPADSDAAKAAKPKVAKAKTKKAKARRKKAKAKKRRLAKARARAASRH